MSKRSPSKLMRRVVFNRFGRPEVLEIQETPVPQAKKGEVLVRMLATSVNGGDLYKRKGSVRIMTIFAKFPKTLGIDIVGVVDKLGPDVTDFKVGDMVWGNTGPKSNATAKYVVVKTNHLSLMPKGLDPIKAAAFPTAGITSLVALVDKGHLKAGERVLIRGTGGVGLTAVQIAKALGAHVTALSSKSTMDEVKSHGADEVFDYRKTSPEELGLFDIIFDTVGTEFGAFRKNLKPDGRFLTSVVSSLFSTVLSVWHGKHRTRLVLAFPKRKTLEYLAQLVNNGDIVPIIDSVYPMEQIVEAHRRAENHGILGKIIINISKS